MNANGGQRDAINMPIRLAIPLDGRPTSAAALRSIIRTPCGKIVEFYPAHIRMNLMPRLQGQGVGSRLLEH
ncbi:hypothetical protein [Rhizobium sp. BK377]|uniref:hypothetical protein n=1 Tax=Rhizobium sp. BK377 TaxID=2587058 RepID=UPI0017F27FFE|nr:hypothetical protein [Rhizobium sp. BK377]MBB3459762.1 GNAT superfamily N-acetyltransferase [Rhizobium sp. BK377]